MEGMKVLTVSCCFGGRTLILIYTFWSNAGCQQVELAEQVDAIVSANLAADSDMTKEKICEKYKWTIEAFKKEQLALPVLVRRILRAS